MSFDSLLNKSCSIQVKTETQDGAGQMQESWTNAYTNVNCRLDTAGGAKTSIPQLIYEKATHILFMRVISGFKFSSKDNRVTIGSTDYEILLVSDAAGHGHHWQIALQLITKVK